MVDRYSHPAENGREAVPIRNHLQDVAERVREVVPEDVTTPSGDRMGEFVGRVALIHDFGKLTTWFQQHIGELDGDPTGNPTHHAPLGALLAYYVLDSLGYTDEECLVGYISVATHHGALPDISEYVFDRTNWEQGSPAGKRQLKHIVAQVKDIDERVPLLAEDIISDVTDGSGSWSEFFEAVTDRTQFELVKEQVSAIGGYTYDPDSISSTFYPCVLQAWSALVLADKTSAANAPRSGYESTPPPRPTLATHIDSLPEDESDLTEREQRLNTWRAEARKSVLESVEGMANSDGRLATLTLPTGMGKTLTGLDAAFRLRDMTDRTRVIYALPFTSIIDQVAGEVKNVFETDGHDDLLTIHHHLAETSVELEDDVDTDERASIEGMLGESWRSGLVVTTYVQLFESLAGPKNTQSMKLPALYDSVVVLDEPQSLPHGWWPLVRRLVEILTEEYGAAVIAMTATQPQLFDSEPLELVHDRKQYFDAVERVEYVIDESVEAFQDRELGPVSYDQAANRIAGDASEGDDVLAVCNTIDSAKELTEKTNERVAATDVGRVYGALLTERDQVSGEHIANAVIAQKRDVATIHLSTRIRPRDRLVLIDAIDELLGRDVSVIVISTQLIEAGVDLGFDRVYRDFAPMDSIVQAAGRCNRSFEQDRGTVTVWWLAAPDEQELTPGEAVYEQWGESLLSVTKLVLESHEIDRRGTVRESVIAWDCVREYYRRLNEERRVGNQSYVEYVDDGAFDELGRLSLIDQQRAVDVIVCRTDTDKNRIEAIKDAWRTFEFEEVRSLLDETKDSRISVPIYRADSDEADALSGLNSVHSGTDVCWIDARNPDTEPYFDETTGFVVPDSSVDGRFL